MIYHSDTVHRRNHEDTRKYPAEHRCLRSDTPESRELEREKVEDISVERSVKTRTNSKNTLTGLTRRSGPAWRTLALVWRHALASVVTVSATHHCNRQKKTE